MKRVSRMMALLVALATGGAVATAATSFSNPASISLPTGPSGTSPGSPYPSPISVAGLSGTITKVTVTLNNISHDRPDDLQLLLVGPTGKKFVLLADAGGTGTPAAGVNLTFDDAAGSLVPDAGPLVSGTFRPTCVDFHANIQTEFAAPAPASPYDVPAPSGAGTLALTFNGTAPNGTWSLYAVDDVPSTPGGSIAGGWTLTITAGATSEPSVTTVVSSQNPSFTGGSVTFTASVKRTNNAAVTNGGVIFLEGATVLQASNAVNAGGQVTFTTSALTEGVHVITAQYTGSTNFSGSSATVTQTVNNATVVSGNTFANRGTNILGDTAQVYPSRIFVTGLAGTISKVTMTVSNITHPRPDDLELLLVAPNGAHFIVLADAGGTAGGLANVTLRFDDTAGSLIADTTAPGTGTYRPTDYNSSAAAFPAPAPAAPYNHPAPAGGSTFANIFNGANPNGTWSLYMVDDVAGSNGTNAGGWSLTFVTSGDAPTMTTLSSSLNPSLTGQSVTFTGAVKRVSDSAVVTNGTVTFREGTNILASNVALNTSGRATFATSALTEGSHIISADYSGFAGSFNVSSGSFTQRVDNATVVSGTRFSNPGAISIAGADSTPFVYPSRINVTGLSPGFCKLSVTISNLTIDRPDDVELLLVSPTGAQLVLMSDVGGTATPANNVTLNFSDAGAGFLPDTGPLATGTFKPTSFNNTAASFPAPAPASPYTHPAPFGAATLNGTFAGSSNGYWSLYVLDDVPGAPSLTMANGWALNFSFPQVATVGGPQSIFSGGTTAGLGGNTPVGTGAWSIAGGGTGTFNPTTSTPNATFTHTGGAGPITLRWSLSDPGCGSSSADVVVMILTTNLVVNATDTGWYDASGAHGPGNANYLAGNVANQYYRDWFAFNIPPLSGPIARAELRVRTYDIISPTGSEIYQLRQVTTPVATLTAGGSGLIGIYNDLGDGPIYAARAFVPGESGRFITFPLNQTLRTAVAAAAGGSFALGGELVTFDADAANSEYVFGSSDGNPGDVQLLLTIGAGDTPTVGYFTDNNPLSTGPLGPISNAGYTPVLIGNIATQNFAGLRILFIDESANGTPDGALLARLPDITTWVMAGGRLIVHDRGAGLTTPNPFLIGTPGLGTVSSFTSDLDVINPATTLVTAGPFGILSNVSLDGGNSSAHGYATNLPPGARAILSIGGNSNQVVSFSYPLGAGFVYYSTIPLDYYLDGEDVSSAIGTNSQFIYTPNVLTYMHTLNPPLRFLPPAVGAGGALPLVLGNADSTAVLPDRVPQIRVYSATNVALPLINWSLLPNPLVLSNGLLRLDGLKATNPPPTFFRAVETP